MGQPVLLVDLPPWERLARELEGALGTSFDVGRDELADVAAAIACAGPGQVAELRKLVEALRAQAPDLPVLLAAPPCGPEALEELLGAGPDDFVTQPVNATDVRARLARMVEGRGHRETVVRRLKVKLGLQRLVGESEAFLGAVETIPLLAGCDATVMIEGETGVGKGVCARAIHYMGPRASKPFVSVNCGALPVELIENELFGHERAAFTSATTSRHGLIEEARGGTLFLDEIDCLPTSAQVKLLHVLQEREYRPLGSPQARSVDVRFLAATNLDLEAAVASGRIRSDLFYRLNVLSLRLPPVRERKDDVLLLARHFLRRLAHKMERPTPQLSPAAGHVLLLHDWPGNVREIEHVIERALVLADGAATIRPAHVRIRSKGYTEQLSFKEAKARAIACFETQYIEALLLAHDGNISRAARAADKNRRAFWELIRKHGIDAASFRSSSGRHDSGH